jgi:UPF0042 nucleotide-binding protein
MTSGIDRGRAKAGGWSVAYPRVLFVDCDDERREGRYTETRRPHPLAGDRLVIDGIRLERRVVSALRDALIS